MIQKTTAKKARSKFQMSVMTKRIKSRFRRKYKKPIKKSKIREVWKDWVELMIVEPLIQKGKVKLDKHCTLEIVGTRLVDDVRLMNFYETLNDNDKLPSRKGICYRIVMTDPRFKEGQLIFEPNSKLLEKVKKAINETNKYYRVEYVN